VTGGKPIAVLLQSIPGLSAVSNLLGEKREVLLFNFVLDTTRDSSFMIFSNLQSNQQNDGHGSQTSYHIVYPTSP
jgi:hypothetical protein